MSLTRAHWQAPGIWGPYSGAVLPGLWVNEGGQSATGALLDLVLRRFGPDGRDGPEAHAAIEARLRTLLAGNPRLGEEIAVLPDMNGNRTPLADPHVRGVITGFSLDESLDGVCALYWRCAVSLALGLRQIIEHMRAHGPGIDRLRPAGGHVRSPLIMQLYADATGCPVEVVAGGEAVLLGTAVSAAVVGGCHATLEEAAQAMAGEAVLYLPDQGRRTKYELDFQVFLAMQRHRDEIARLRRPVGGCIEPNR